MPTPPGKTGSPVNRKSAPAKVTLQVRETISARTKSANATGSRAVALPPGFDSVFGHPADVSRSAAASLSDMATLLGPSPARIWQASTPFRAEETFPAAMLEAQADGKRLIGGAAGVGRARLLVDDEFRQYFSHALRYAKRRIWVCASMLNAHHRGVRAMFRSLRDRDGERPDIRFIVAEPSGSWALIGTGALRHSEVRSVRGAGRAHLRMALFDDSKIVAGSHGLTPTSLFASREASLAIEGDEQLVDDAAHRFAQLWDEAMPL